MAKTERANEHWLLNLLMMSSLLRRGGRLLNKMLASCLGIKVVPANSLTVGKGWVDSLLYFERLFGLLKNVQGDVVECGVSSGTSFVILCTLAEKSGIRRYIFGFDSFEGLPAPSAEDLSSPKSIAKRGMYSASPEMVLSNLKLAGVNEHTINNQITLVKGLFSQTLPKYSGSAGVVWSEKSR